MPRNGHTDLDFGPLASVTRRITDDILNGTMQKGRTAEDRDFVLNHATHTALSALRFEVRVLGDVANELVRRDRSTTHGIVTAFEAGEGQQAADEFVEAIGFELDALQNAVGLRTRTLPGQPRGHTPA